MTDPLDAALAAAHAAGELLRSHFADPKDVASFEAHDIKLDLDVQAQDLITGMLLDKFPAHALYGEEGIAGDQSSAFQWIVDPIDGTVNYFYGIPHFCISIALRENNETLVGVIHDPMRGETWQVERGGRPTLNGRPFSVSPRTKLSDAIVTVGFAKSAAAIQSGLPLLERMAGRARKCRMLGSAALDMAYVACGRMDAYIESSISLWDIAAGKLLVEAAGGRVDLTESPHHKDKFAIVASNGKIDLELPDA